LGVKPFAVLALALVLGGCSSVGASAVPTGAARLPPYSGAVAIFLAHEPAGAAELGVVEVHASQSEATVDALLPLFVRKAAALGANAVVVDEVQTYFDVVTHAYPETYAAPCGWRSTCYGSRVVPVNDEVMTISMRGRAMRIPEAPR
jgi:hypothetical protein